MVSIFDSSVLKFFLVITTVESKELVSGDLITIRYHHLTSLPVICGFHNVLSTSSYLALEGIYEPSMLNLTSLQEHLFHWDTNLVHIGWQHTQWIGWCGLLGTLGIKMGSTTVYHPKCAACRIGSRNLLPAPVLLSSRSKMESSNSTSLNLATLCSLTNTIPHSLEASSLHMAMTLVHRSFAVAPYFCNATSTKLTVVHQFNLNGTENFQAKICF